jgi:hypothetical protein
MLPRPTPIYFMTSFARSGETLLLRCLDAHPCISVLHQIRKKKQEPPAAKILLSKIKERASTRIWFPRGLASAFDHSILLVKNMVWVHRYPYRGFTLARNPYSIIASMKKMAVAKNETNEFQRQRLIRWAGGICPSLRDFAATGDEVAVLATLYREKMDAALRTGHPVVHYEDFVSDPEQSLRRILGHINLPWDGRVLASESGYAPGEIGHGGIELWKPVEPARATYGGGLTDAEVDTISSITENTRSALGYTAPRFRTYLPIM